jgi:hypothetical protein
MKHYVLAKINDNSCRDIKCPDLTCTQILSYQEVKHCVDPENYEKYDRFLLTAALNSDPDCRWCPRPGCATAMLGQANEPMLICPNEKCNFSFCFNCREEVCA